MKKIIPSLLLLLVSCQSELSQLSEITVELAPNTAVESLRMADFVESVEYIQLETTPESLIGNVSLLYADGDYLIIPSNGGVYFFNSDGSFSHKFKHHGKGPGEYLSMSGVMVDSEGKRVIIYDSKANRILYYDYRGEFLSKVDDFAAAGQYIREIINLPNGNFLCSDHLHGPVVDNLVELWEVDPLGQLVQNLHVSEFRHPTVSPNYSLSYCSHGDIGYIDIEMDRDFIYRDGTITPVVSYDIKGERARDFKGKTNSEFVQTHWGRYRNMIAKTYTTFEGDYIFSEWTGEKFKEGYYTLVNRRDGTIAIGASLDGRLPNSQKIYPSKIISKESYFVTKENIEGVIVVATYPAECADQELYKMLGVGEREAANLNPVLQLLHLKR